MIDAETKQADPKQPIPTGTSDSAGQAGSNVTRLLIGAGIATGIGSAAVAAAMLYAGRAKKKQGGATKKA